MRSTGLSCSIVIFKPDLDLLEQTLSRLALAIAHSRCIGIQCARVFVIDNEHGAKRNSEKLYFAQFGSKMGGVNIELVSGQGNIGYGRGHNLGITQSDSDYHLVLNPDVLLAEDALVQAIEFMESNLECGLLAAKVLDGRGTVQYLCKRYPTVTDLVLRGFMPAFVRRAFQKRLYRYEMRDVIGDRVVWDVPIVSGCFMLFRRSVLEKLKGFSPEYFLYFEDFDISLRAGQITRTAYVPSVQIVHFGGYAAKKGLRHISMFIRSAITFFNRHGWKLW